MYALKNTDSAINSPRQSRPRDRSISRSTSRRLLVEQLEDRKLLAATVFDPDLAVSEVVTGLNQPINMAFIGDNDFFVLEKATGQVKRVQDGAVTSTVLDLPVNSNSERGLLGIALHPKFNKNGYVYLFWTESSTGADSAQAAEVPLLGNRVDRFRWDGQSLTHNKNIIQLRAFQQDITNPVPNDPLGRIRGNHDGGVIRFDKQGKLFIIVGDTGRRGQMQNLVNGPFGPGIPDDQFGGPEPDDAHLTGVILRLNDDGSTPRDNPFFKLGKQVGGEAGENLQKVYAYGVRNSFGMAVDPVTGRLWNQENADDAFDEINIIEPGQNNGWVQIMGPVDRIAEFKQIETTFPTPPGSMQQNRWPPQNIADTPAEALSRLNVLPGSHYSDPEFSWKWAVAPAAIGFLDSKALGKEYENDLFVGAARTTLDGGYLFRFDLTKNRKHLDLQDSALADRVADNTAKFDPTESESLAFGKDFGIGTDIQTGPNGNLYVVSLSNGVVYEIFRLNQAKEFEANLSGSQEVPPVATRARGEAEFKLTKNGTELKFEVEVKNIEDVVQSHIHIGPPGANGPVVAFLFGPEPGGITPKKLLATGRLTDGDIIARPDIGFDGTLASLVREMRLGNAYVNVHTLANPGGEIRGQIFPERDDHDDHDDHDDSRSSQSIVALAGVQIAFDTLAFDLEDEPAWLTTVNQLGIGEIATDSDPLQLRLLSVGTASEVERRNQANAVVHDLALDELATDLLNPLLLDGVRIDLIRR